MQNRVTAVFNSQIEAEYVINELRALGIKDDALSLVTRRMETHGVVDGESIDGVPSTEENAAKGLAAGAGLGALFGLASAFIPGVGPFMAAGALAAVIGTIGASTVAGAVVGGATGAIGGALIKAGYTDEESRYYGDELERGHVFVSVNLDENPALRPAVFQIFVRHAGRSAMALV
jgi:hypothetical protein